MAVKTSTFGGISLTGEDAKAFLKQVNASSPSKEAREALERGRRMVQEFKEQGFVRVQLKTK